MSKARVKLEYSYSPALAARPVADQPDGQRPGGGLRLLGAQGDRRHPACSRRHPPHLITEFNLLDPAADRPLHHDVRGPAAFQPAAKVSNTSELQLEEIHPADLFRKRRPGQAAAAVLRQPRSAPAGACSSVAWPVRRTTAAWRPPAWSPCSCRVSYRAWPPVFPPLLEKGDAIVLLSGAANLDGVPAATVKGPSLTLMAHPADPFGKLLILRGDDSEQLKHARPGAGHRQPGAVRRPRPHRSASTAWRRASPMTPNWLPSDRPVRLGELADAKRLSVSGYDPGTINLPLRLPPDLFNWRQPGVPLHLKYRYTPQPVSTNSSLLISVSRSTAAAAAVAGEPRRPCWPSCKMTAAARRLPRLPLDSLPLQSALQLRFMYDYIKQGDCRDIIIDNMRGTIEPDSTLDLSDYEHSIAMPIKRSIKEKVDRE